MARSIWKGSIAFGLVQIPVELFVAEEPHELSFRQLDKHDFSPVGYDRINKRTGKKVAWDDIVRGYEWDKDEYVVLSDEELQRTYVEATHRIDIVAFVDADEIDPMYFEKPYYLAPSKQGTKAYALLRETLERSKQIGIAKIVIRTRQHLAALMPKGEMLVLETLRYAHEFRGAEELPIPKGSLEKIGVSEAEMKMAQMLVHGMHEHFKPDKYKDEFHDKVLALIEKKAKAGEVNTVAELPEERHAAKRPGKVVDLMEMLKQSLGEKGIEENKGPGVKHAAPRRTHHKPHARKSA